MTNFGTRKTLLRRVPGFRRRNPAAMVLALTWFGAAALLIARHLWWGLAMASVPFFLFAIADAGLAGRRNRRVLAIVAAGVLVLVALGGGLAHARQTVVRPIHEGAPSITATAATTAPGQVGSRTTETATASPDIVTAAIDTNGAVFVASRQGEVYHRPDCASAKRIKPENLVAFPSWEEAKAAGLRPCKKCKPDEAYCNAANPTQTTAPGGSP